MSSYAERNARAAAELARRGLAADVKGAQYRLRIEDGRRRGLSARQAAGKARKGVEATVSELRRTGRLAPPPRRLKGGTSAVVNGRRVVTSSIGGEAIRAIRAAARKGERIVIRTTVDTSQGPRTLTLGDGPVRMPEITGGWPGSSTTVREV